MSVDVTKKIDEIAEKLHRDFNEFKQENDKRLSLIEKKGTAGADREEKVDRISNALTDMEEKIEKLQTAMNRAHAGGGDAALEAKALEQKANQAMNQYLRQSSMGDEQKQAYLTEFSEAYKGLDEYKSLSVDSNPDGGYLVRPTISAQIQQKIFESSPMRELAGSETISTDAFEEAYDADEPESGWVGEREERKETDTAGFKMIRIPVHELYAEPKATQKLLQDTGVDLEAWHMNKVVEKFGRDEAKAFILGDGVSQPRGILSYAAGDGFNKLEQFKSGEAADITADALIDMQDGLLEQFQTNAVWLMRRQTRSAIRKLKNDEGRYLFAVGGDLISGAPATLLGKPIRFAAHMPEVKAGALPIAYGDFRSGYLVVDRIGISVLRDPFTKKGFVKFYTTKRVGGGVRHFQAIKLMVVSA